MWDLNPRSGNLFQFYWPKPEFYWIGFPALHKDFLWFLYIVAHSLNNPQQFQIHTERNIQLVINFYGTYFLNVGFEPTLRRSGPVLLKYLTGYATGTILVLQYNWNRSPNNPQQFQIRTKCDIQLVINFYGTYFLNVGFKPTLRQSVPVLLKYLTGYATGTVQNCTCSVAG